MLITGVGSVVLSSPTFARGRDRTRTFPLIFSALVGAGLGVSTDWLLKSGIQRFYFYLPGLGPPTNEFYQFKLNRTFPPPLNGGWMFNYNVRRQLYLVLT